MAVGGTVVASRIGGPARGLRRRRSGDARLVPAFYPVWGDTWVVCGGGASILASQRGGPPWHVK